MPSPPATGPSAPPAGSAEPPELTSSRFPVTALALRSAQRALTAAAGLWTARTGQQAPAVEVDAEDVLHAFAAERHVLVDGAAPSLWDPLAGSYRSADGWVRLHTNYLHHRRAAVRALGLGTDPGQPRDVVEAAVRSRAGHEVEDAVGRAGGAATALRTPQQWRCTPQAAAVDARPLVAVRPLPTVGERAAGCGTRSEPTRPELPCAGLRVLDLTRVIAGPTAGKVLAALGADVLRVDPPGFAEVPVLVADTTAGKRCTALDLGTGADAEAFERLVRGADVVLTGLRPGASVTERWTVERLAALRPGLVLGRLSAWGDTGPWGNRRGFDSLVQVATGIARVESGGEGAVPPGALPMQVLDHASGWLLAAGVLESLAARYAAGGGPGVVVDVVLARTAHELLDAPAPVGRAEPAAGPRTEDVASTLGQVRRVQPPGRIGGQRLRWAGSPSALGSAAPVWRPDCASSATGAP